MGEWSIVIMFADCCSLTLLAYVFAKNKLSYGKKCR